MGYLHIDNLYKNQDVLLFKECYALEKIHGTSAHLIWHFQDGKITYSSGGASHTNFLKLFQDDLLSQAFKQLGVLDRNVTVYGEAYGGKEQGMSATYGKEMKFIVFDVQIGDSWLSVPQAEDVAKKLGLEFVYYVKIPTTLEALDKERDAESQQAIRNGMGPGKAREGVVLRPLIEVIKNNGARVLSKHKGDAFKETATPRKVVDPAQMQILADAQAVADEWVTLTRLEHVLQKIPDHGMEKMRDILAAMVADVLREGIGEIVPSTAVEKAIAGKTAVMYKSYLKAKLQEIAV